MRTFLCMIAMFSLTGGFAQEYHHPGTIFSTHAEGPIDDEDLYDYKSECEQCLDAQLYGEYPTSYLQRVEDSATAYPSKEDDSFYEQMTR